AVVLSVVPLTVRPVVRPHVHANHDTGGTVIVFWGMRCIRRILRRSRIRGQFSVFSGNCRGFPRRSSLSVFRPERVRPPCEVPTVPRGAYSSFETESGAKSPAFRQCGTSSDAMVGACEDMSVRCTGSQDMPLLRRLLFTAE